MGDTPYAQVGCIVLLGAAFAGFGTVLGAKLLPVRLPHGGARGGFGWELRLYSFGCGLRLEASVVAQAFAPKLKGLKPLGFKTFCFGQMRVGFINKKLILGYIQFFIEANFFYKKPLPRNITEPESLDMTGFFKA